MGDANIKHIKEVHPVDFEKYGSKIEEIIKYPTYLKRKVLRTELVAVAHQNDVGNVGLPPHLTFLI